jgi:hypothetical protein
MAEDPKRLRNHIEVLTKFERDYREFIEALEADFSAPDANWGERFEGSGWSKEKWNQRKRQLQMDSVRADLAVKASGVGALIFTEAPVAGGGIRAADLPSQIFDFIEVDAFRPDDGLTFQRKLLERMPSQIAGLEVRLEEAESESRPLHQTKAATRDSRNRNQFAWLNHPWVVGVGVTVIGGGILAAIIALIH